MIKISQNKKNDIIENYACEYSKIASEYFENKNKVKKANARVMKNKDLRIALSNIIELYRKMYKQNVKKKKTKRIKLVDPEKLGNCEASTRLIKKLNEELFDSNYSQKYFIKSAEEIQDFCGDYYITNKDERKYFNVFVKQFFDWDKFRDKNAGLLEKIYTTLAVGVCPYCNRNYTSIFGENKKGNKIRPSLDHFFTKKEFPFLALNLWNLIPSCDYCNSKVKYDKEQSFKLENKRKVYIGAINPLLEGFGNNIRFKLTPKNDEPLKIYEAYYNFNQSSDYYNSFEITFYKKKVLAGDDCISYKSSISLFQLKDLYNAVHIKDAVDIAVKAYYYDNPAYWQSYKRILSSDEEKSKYGNISPLIFLKYLLFGRALDENEQINIPLSKLTCDIFNQFKTNSDSKDYEPLILND